MKAFRSAVIAAFICVSALPGSGAAAQSSRATVTARAGFFGEEQARRGKTAFATACASCHAIDPKAAGIRPLAGEDSFKKWRTVGDLYSRVRMTMPANNVGGLTSATYLDILAYILQANGVPAGSDLTSDVSSLHRLVLAKAAPGSKIGIDVSTGRFYTEAQAARGEAYYRGQCLTCHTMNPDGKFTAAERAFGYKGSMFGNQERVWPLAGGRERLERWGNVFNLFTRVRSMPQHDSNGLSRETYVDITAFFLKYYGAPAGTEELRYSVNAMKSMTFDEPAFEKVFNGRDFTGIRFVLGANCAPKPAGCGQTEPGETFKVHDGALVTSGTPLGYWYQDKKYLNFTLRAEYRYPRPPELETDEDFAGNSGYLLFITKHGVWPKTIEIQGANRGVLNVFPIDSMAKFTVDNEARRRALKPVGEWNAFEIVSRNNTVRTYLNGTPISIITEHEFKEPGYIGFQSEGAELQWRNIRIKPE